MTDLVIGTGQVGQPIARLLLNSGKDVVVRDIEDIPDPGEIYAVHICYEFGDDFVDATVNYLKQYTPRVCFIHSTVVPGTSRKIQDGMPFVDVVYSPVKGRHGEFGLGDDMEKYAKWIATMHSVAQHNAVVHLGDIWDLRTVTKFETLELAKLLETSYTGVLVAWAQEMNRYAELVGADLDQAILFTDEIEYLPAYQFVPGYIGGHCVMQNIDILQDVRHSGILQAVTDSNDKRKEELKEEDALTSQRVFPKQLR